MPENKVGTTISTPVRIMLELKAMELGINVDYILRDCIHSYLCHCLNSNPDCFGEVGRDYKNDLNKIEVEDDELDN